MQKNLLTLAFISTALVVSACGGENGPGTGTPVDSKESAAGAAYGVKQKGEGLHDRSGRGLRPSQSIPGIGDGNVSAEQTTTVDGMSGKAIITEKADITTGSVMAEYTIKYESFSDDGVDFFDGEVTHRAIVDENGVEAQVVGKVDISGTKLASLDMDVYVKVTAGGIEIRGFVDADGTRYDYNGEVLALDDIE